MSKPTLPGRSAAGLLLVALAPPLSAAIYRCGADGEVPRYSQFPCDEHAEVVLETTQIIRVPPLSEAEQVALDTLARDRAERVERRQQARREAARRASRKRDERRERCRAARSALDALERQRRKGYSLQQARELDRREAELEAEEQSNCR